MAQTTSEAHAGPFPLCGHPPPLALLRFTSRWFWVQALSIEMALGLGAVHRDGSGSRRCSSRWFWVQALSVEMALGPGAVHRDGSGSRRCPSRWLWVRALSIEMALVPGAVHRDGSGSRRCPSSRPWTRRPSSLETEQPLLMSRGAAGGRVASCRSRHSWARLYRSSLPVQELFPAALRVACEDRVCGTLSRLRPDGRRPSVQPWGSSCHFFRNNLHMVIESSVAPCFLRQTGVSAPLSGSCRSPEPPWSREERVDTTVRPSGGVVLLAALVSVLFPGEKWTPVLTFLKGKRFLGLCP